MFSASVLRVGRTDPPNFSPYIRILSARWLQRLLTVDQNESGWTFHYHVLNVSSEMKKNFYDFLLLLTKLGSISTLRGQKKESNQWAAKDKPTPKKAKEITLAVMVVATIFVDSCGVIFLDHLEKGKNINGKYYTGILQGLDQEIKNKRPYLVKKILFREPEAEKIMAFTW